MPGPFEVWLLQTRYAHPVLEGAPGVETVLELAALFAGHPALSALLCPGLPGHPGHQIAAR